MLPTMDGHTDKSKTTREEDWTPGTEQRNYFGFGSQVPSSVGSVGRNYIYMEEGGGGGY